MRKGKTKFKLNPTYKRLIKYFGSQTALAKELKVHPASISYWLREKKVPIKHIHTIEKLTHGEIKARDLRPDIF